MSNPFAALVDESGPSSSINQAFPDCLFIESIFGFSLDKQRSAQKRYVHLAEQAEVFSGRQMDVEVLEHTLFERLFLEEPSAYLVNDGATENDSENRFYESKVINYLYNCYYELAGVQHSLKNELIALITRNVVTAMKQPDLHEGQTIFKQFYDIVKDELDGNSGQFFMDVYKKFLEEDDDVQSLKDPYYQILALLEADLQQATLIMYRSDSFYLLQMFTSTEHLAPLVIDFSKPGAPETGLKYTKTLLGALFNISILPKTTHGAFEYFTNPLDQSSNTSTENLLYSNTDKITSLIHGIILNLLKNSPNTKSNILKWIGNCLKANTDRGKLWNAQNIDLGAATNTVCDGFMINLCYVLMRLCNPFSSLENHKKILKVDPTYCAVKAETHDQRQIHLPDMFKETCLLPHDTDQDTSVAPMIAKSYNFVTECFFMAHRALDLGYKVTIDKLMKLTQDIGRMERAFNEAVAQAGSNNEVVENIQKRMQGEITKYLSVKAMLSEPILVKMTYHFLSSTCYWLSQVSANCQVPTVSVDIDSYAPLTERPVDFPMPHQIPNTLECIPEFVIENVVSYLVFLRRFQPRMFESEGVECLQPILTCVLTFMGGGGHNGASNAGFSIGDTRAYNPHLRARLAEAMESMLPHHKDEPAAINTLGGYVRERLFKEYAHRQQIVVSLLEVFVGIELTGQSVQFEQKFNYRRPMYLVMDYLWEFNEYQEFFIALAIDAENNMEAVNPPLFLRFVNLLMNDAVFLLDEALANMAKLKEMQTQRENGDWDTLPANERQQNLGYIQHIGMIAKFDNILGRDTINTIEKLTSRMTIVFTHTTMVDRVAAMLNYFLMNLVGPNQKNFKVKDQKEYHFDPADTVLRICLIYTHLASSSAFCLAISQDGRSYRPELFQLAQDVLVKIGGGALIAEIAQVAENVALQAVQHRATEDAMQEAPEEYLDPIMSTLMLDPVTLPSSKQIVDRTTIARHLLSDQTDPFNRSPLTMDQIIPNVALAKEIRDWLSARQTSSNN